MTLRKFGTGEVLGVERAEEDLRKTAAQEWDQQAEQELEDENQEGDDGLPR